MGDHFPRDWREIAIYVAIILVVAMMAILLNHPTDPGEPLTQPAFQGVAP